MFRTAVLISMVVLVIFLLALSAYSPEDQSPPPAVPPAESESSPVSADENDIEKHAEQLRTKLSGRGFTVLIEKPFVVIGDEPEETVRRRSVNTVRFTVEKLKQDYFTKDPQNILNIWLFKDEVSYAKHAKEFFNDEPTTPYGYYSSANRALVMNIATGGGTLVHEIVHPFIEANFPEAPAWFNEGMGSLYEQTGEVDGHIHGYTNWRLPGLQEGLRKGKVLSFKSLTSLSDSKFYSDDTGVSYAQARYLCYYLQEKKLLVKFYREFLANHKSDPSGYRTLQKVLRERNMLNFQRRWEAFVLKLRVGFDVEAD